MFMQLSVDSRAEIGDPSMLRRHGAGLAAITAYRDIHRFEILVL